MAAAHPWRCRPRRAGQAKSGRLPTICPYYKPKTEARSNGDGGDVSIGDLSSARRQMPFQPPALSEPPTEAAERAVIAITIYSSATFCFCQLTTVRCCQAL